MTLIDTYSFGSPITPANFVSFQYMSADQQFTFDQITGSGPGLQDLGSFVGEFMLFTKNGDDFEVVPDGTWVASDNRIDGGTGGQLYSPRGVGGSGVKHLGPDVARLRRTWVRRLPRLTSRHRSPSLSSYA